MTNEELRSARIAEAVHRARENWRDGRCPSDNQWDCAIAEHMADLCETNWTPPVPVDSDLLAAREWFAATSLHGDKDILAGRCDRWGSIVGFLAGAAHARKAPRVWTDAQVERAARVRWSAFAGLASWPEVSADGRIGQITAMRAALDALEAPE